MLDYRMINGVKVNGFSSRKSLIQYIQLNKGILVAINAEKILHATKETRNIINNNISYTDGIGAVLAVKKKGLKDVEKIPGCELWLDILKNTYQKNTFYLVGGTEETIQNTYHQLIKEYPEVKIVGYRNGYIKSESEKNELLIDIQTKKPDVVFVAMGSPKQELLMEEMYQLHPAIYQGLGGSFDVYTGKVKRAPEWWVKNNLEWAYRLIKQPTRIKRQIHLVKFLGLLYLGRI